MEPDLPCYPSDRQIEGNNPPVHVSSGLFCLAHCGGLSMFEQLQAMTRRVAIQMASSDLPQTALSSALFSPRTVHPVLPAEALMLP